MRLIEVQDAQTCPCPLVIQPGDLLLVRAAGCHLLSGTGVVELLGPFVAAVLGDNGQILTPMGPPNVVLFLARHKGQASVEIVSGDPFHSPQRSALLLAVEG